MSTSGVKRKQFETTNPAHMQAMLEMNIHKLIRSRKEEGIWATDISKELNLPPATLQKFIRNLISGKKIKEVANVKNKGKKFYMSVEFEPSEEQTGGFWCTGGSLDNDNIENVKQKCLNEIRKLEVGTIEEIASAVRQYGNLGYECPVMRIEQIVKSLAIGGQIIETKSTGRGEFSAIPLGYTCYKYTTYKPTTGALASIPCGVCPHMSICTPDGLVSPSNCVYFDKWLDF